MIYSSKIDYAISALVFLAQQPEGLNCNVEKIGSALGIPQPYLAKVLQELVHDNILESSRGKSGGFRLATSAEEITLYEIISKIENISSYEDCIFVNEQCSMDKGCSVICKWYDVQKHIFEFLRGHSIADLRAIREFRSQEGNDE